MGIGRVPNNIATHQIHIPKRSQKFLVCVNKVQLRLTHSGYHFHTNPSKTQPLNSLIIKTTIKTGYPYLSVEKN
jgi:hypothetical protein